MGGWKYMEGWGQPFPYDLPASSANRLPGCPYHGSALRSFQNLPVMCSHSLSAPAKGQHCTCNTGYGRSSGSVPPHALQASQLSSHNPPGWKASHTGVSAPSLAGRGPRKLAIAVLHRPVRIGQWAAGRQAVSRAGAQPSSSGRQQVLIAPSAAVLALPVPPGHTAATAMRRGRSSSASMRLYWHSASLLWTGPSMRATHWCVTRVCIHTAGPLKLQTGIELHACASSTRTHTHTRTSTSTGPLAPHAIHRPGPAFLGISAAGAEGANQHATSSGAGVRHPTPWLQSRMQADATLA